MLSQLRNSLITTTALIAMLCFVPMTVRAAEISDGGGFFSAEALSKANQSIRELELKSGHEVRIETFAAIPAEKAEAVSKMDAKQRDTFFSKWVFERAEATKSRGLFVLICRNPSHLNLWAGTPIQKAGFGAAQAKLVREALLTQLKAKEYDRALTEGVTQLTATFGGLSHASTQASKATPPQESKTVARTVPTASDHVPVRHAPNSHTPAHAAQNSPWSGMLVLLVFVVGGMFVISLIGRLFGGGRSGGMGGYGQPGYGGGYGGGGGGFLSSLTGGIFGAMAGNWMYDQFSGRHASGGEFHSSGNSLSPSDSSSSGFDSDSSDGGYSGGTDFGGGDFGGGSDGGGGSDMGGSGDF